MREKHMKFIAFGWTWYARENVDWHFWSLSLFRVAIFLISQLSFVSLFLLAWDVGALSLMQFVRRCAPQNEKRQNAK